MKKSKLYFLIFSVVILSCVNTETEKQYSIKDFIRNENPGSICVDSVRTYDRFIELFDTIPTEFGEIIFNDILNSIPFDSSKFRRIWSWEIDTITSVIGAKNNNIFDRDNVLSDDTYFLIVSFTTVKSYPIAGTIYADFKREKLGTFIMERDSINFSYIKLSDDSVRVENLNSKLKIYNR